MGETRKIAAILVADVVGYSRLAGADEDRILARLRALRSDLFDPTISLHHGRVVKRTGDGILIEFRSVVDAVRCAIEVQNGMAERNEGLPPERRIELRVGIHLGDVVEEADGDLMGDGVNIAARLEGIAKPGAICLSEDAYRQVSSRLDMEVTDLGPTQLKNIERPIRAYSLQVGQPALAKPAPSATPADQPKAVASAAHLSVVVLPFANLSGDPAQDYLADALTDEVTTSLARIPGSFVIARNTASTYKGKAVDARAIGKELGVRYVLEGSVQPSSDQVRVNAQLIDAESGAHLWAEQFDTARAALLQTQDEIVIHLARAMGVRLMEAEASRLKRRPAANPDAEDLALQCQAALDKAGWLGKEAEAAYPLCEQALRVDPNNVHALWVLAMKFHMPVNMGTSTDPKADLKRADELVSQALTLDPTAAAPHGTKAWVLFDQGRFEEAIAERERALALDPADVGTIQGLAWDYTSLGHFEKGLELFDKAIRLSPRDSALQFMDFGKSWTYFGLKQYDQAIEWARRAIAIGPNNPFAQATLTVALALTGHQAEAREALQHYLAMPSSAQLRTIAALKAYDARFANVNSDPRAFETNERNYEGLRKAGMPEE